MSARNEGTVLEVKGLQTYFHTADGVVKAVDGLSYQVKTGEVVGLVGESGCGKSVSAMSVLRLIPYPPGVIAGGQIIFKGEDLLQASEERMRDIRGNRIAMVFQEPTTSLNPVLTVGRQISESLELHRRLNGKAARAESIRLLSLVGIPDPAKRVTDYPYQFSGGMQQRVIIAMALSCNPELLIADEPTTSLDVTVQAQLLEIISNLRQESHMAVVIITHNLGLVARYVDRVNVMYAGKLVESGPTRTIFAEPKHPYTLGLLASVPRLDSHRKVIPRVIPGLPPNLAHLPQGCSFAPRCAYATDECRSTEPKLEPVGADHERACFYDAAKLQKVDLLDWPMSNGSAHTPGTRESGNGVLVEVSNLVKYFPVTAGVLRRKVGDVKAVDDVSFTIKRGETLGLVGESGCGKTTTGRCVLQLYPATSGRVLFDGTDLARVKGEQLRRLRRHMQLIFQDPFASLDPRMTAGATIGEPLLVHKIARGGDYRRRVTELLNMVELDPTVATRYPHEFSGGQRQRLGIARALAVNPDFIVCDEAVSALDVSIQAQIITLLMKLREEFNLTYLFIAHDLAVVRNISDRVAVMYLGKIVEVTTSDQLYSNPRHPYTISLLSAVPIPDPVVDRTRVRIVLEGDVPSPMNPPGGCPFHTRCPHVTDICRREVPPLKKVGDDHLASCHLLDSA